MKILKLKEEELQLLLLKHIFELSQIQMKALSFLFDIEISRFIKTGYSIHFTMNHAENKVCVNCMNKGNISMGRNRRQRNGLSNMKSFGGQFSFADCISTYRAFFSGEWEVTLHDANNGPYTKGERQLLVLKANEIVSIRETEN